MARKTIYVSDLTGQEIEEGKGVTLRLTYEDGRRPSVEVDANSDDPQLAELVEKGRKVARRGRRPAGT